jgi:hypothetical protein
MDDFVQAGNIGSNPITGTYTLSNDGNGNINLVFPSGGSSAQFGITLIDTAHLYLIETDGFGAGGGSAELQDTSAFSSVPSGTLVFRLHGNSTSQGSSASVGAITSTSGNVAGNEDVLRAGVASSLTLTGVFNAPGAAGRGTVSLSDSSGFTGSYLYYVVNARTLRLLETDLSVFSLGRAEQQSSTTFSNGSLSGSFAFGSQGDTSANIGGVHTVGAFTFDGAGNITTGAFDSVQDGNQFVNNPLTGTYAMSPPGRAAVTVNPQNGTLTQEIFWMVSPARAFFLINSSSKVEDGTLDQQQSSAFANSSLNGQYAFVMDGFTSNTFLDRVGTLQADGNTNLALNEAANSFIPPGPGSVNLPGLLPGNYSVSQNGRVTASINTLSSNLVFYLVSNSSAYTLQNDSGVEISGTIGVQ